MTGPQDRHSRVQSCRPFGPHHSSIGSVPRPTVVATTYRPCGPINPLHPSPCAAQISFFFCCVLMISAEERFMSGREDQEEAVLAAVRTLKAVDSKSESQ